ncbi:N-acetylmuramate alpha-1-phosphate uridylyltransferase MurU [Neptunomonas antarctica]|uniref:MurNAc alpha-1-phosphate uridylyltransferase n=1 Tax=Neptunomonas antarctica TaxID=619304 RepID=A0A1N7JDV3_9GAMM|nr:nucleotidyltransferase family protein [Neptunomonas antarctica]SIS47505.1 MurNAc alpha-1-phosphate uridylyltransferase [Neptunomonas antarctica]
MKAMILAAGLGTRLRPLTLSTPKPLVPVNGKALIVYHIEKLAKAGVNDIIINHAWLGEQIETALGDGSQWGVNITYSPEGEPLETGGGIFRVLDRLSENDEPFIVINGDIMINFDYSLLMDNTLLEGATDDIAHLVLVPNPEHHPEGDFACLPDGRLSMQGNKQTFSGVSVLTPRLFAGCDAAAFALGPLLKRAIDEGQVSGSVYPGFWIDVGTYERLQQAETFYKSLHKLTRE